MEVEHNEQTCGMDRPSSLLATSSTSVVWGPRRHNLIGEKGGLEPGAKLVPGRHIGVVLILWKIIPS